MLRCVDHDGVQYALRAHTGSTNVLTNVQLPTVNEVVYGQKLSKNDQVCIVSLEQKSVMLMRDIVQKFSKPGHSVLDSFLGPFYTSNTSLFWEKHRLVECDKNPSCL